jgi:hypothetical protein
LLVDRNGPSVTLLVPEVSVRLPERVNSMLKPRILVMSVRLSVTGTVTEGWVVEMA